MSQFKGPGKYLSVVFWLILFLGCAQQTNPDQPPEILFGQDVCDECRMMITDPQFAAAARDSLGNAYRFDDIGCLVEFFRKKGQSPARAWVMDYQQQSWIPLEKAWFVHTDKIITPMAYGIIAVSDSVRASKLASQWRGKLLNSARLFQWVQSNNRTGG